MHEKDVWACAHHLVMVFDAMQYEWSKLDFIGHYAATSIIQIWFALFHAIYDSVHTFCFCNPIYDQVHT